jgi:hypothetical protein
MNLTAAYTIARQTGSVNTWGIRPFLLVLGYTYLMGMEGIQQQEVDPKLRYESIADSFTENIQRLDALVASVIAEDGALPSKREEEVRALQDKILKHAPAF